jgi:hypothetical protein
LSLTLSQEYRVKVETELTNICNDILNILDRHLIPSATTGESKVCCNLRLILPFSLLLAHPF